MTTDVRFTAHPSARPLLQAPAPPAMPAGQPLGYPAAGDDAQGLANSLDAIRRNPPRTMPALGEDLLAEALLRYAQRNRTDGQAAPSAGYGGGQAPLGGAPTNVSSTQTGDVASGPLSLALGGGATPPDATAGQAPIDPLKPYQDASAWAAVMQRLRPQIGPNGGTGYGRPDPGQQHG